MDARSQRRLLPLRSGAPLPADDHGPGLRLRGGQCRSAIPQSRFAVELDQATDIGAQVQQDFRAGLAQLHPAGEPLGVRLRAAVPERGIALRRQYVALGTGRRDRPLALARTHSLRDAWAHELPADRRRPLYRHARPLWLLLVPAPRDG